MTRAWRGREAARARSCNAPTLVEQGGTDFASAHKNTHISAGIIRFCSAFRSGPDLICSLAMSAHVPERKLIGHKAALPLIRWSAALGLQRRREREANVSSRRRWSDDGQFGQPRSTTACPKI